MLYIFSHTSLSLKKDYLEREAVRIVRLEDRSYFQVLEFLSEETRLSPVKTFQLCRHQQL